MTRAYSFIYVSKAARSVGNMLHDAVYAFGMEGGAFLERFIQSGVARQIEDGNPKYLAGKSGLELFLEVMERTTGQEQDAEPVECYERSDAYWVGWMLIHYQWYSCRSFASILNTVPYGELLGLYSTLHEADVQKSYQVLDAHFSAGESRLKRTRKRVGMTQEELAAVSGVSVNSIRAYEQKNKDLGKAQTTTVRDLARALRCDAADILE